MATKGPGERLLGRRSEREVLDRLLEAVRGGQSGVLVVRGEPGVGKTALLEYAIESARGFRVVRAVGVEWEMELAFAALQQLCAPMLDRLERLPAPQREALRRGVRPESGGRAGSVPGRARGAEPVVRGGRASSRFCASSMTRSGSIGRRRRRLRSSRGGCWRSRSRWCSRRASRARSSAGSRSCSSRVCATAMRGRCWARCCGVRWMSGCGTGSWPRRAGIRWRCSSCRAG